MAKAKSTVPTLHARFVTRFEWEDDEAYMAQHDIVKVVRCKDCKHKEREQPGMVYCPMMVGSWVDDDHFCKWGERGE